jgi:Protein of unknown function (DUF1449)
MHAIDLLQWWNLIFDLPFVAALIPLLLQAAGAAHFGHGGHGVHIDHASGALHGHHVHLPHMPHLAHHQAGPAEAHVAAAAGSSAAHAPTLHTPTAHAPAHHAASPGPISRALGLLGIGKVPVMLVFSSFCFIWGFTGLAANLLLAGVYVLPAAFILPSIAIALFSSLLLTGILSQGISKVMPSVETYTTPREGFLGKSGRALYEINCTCGAAVVLDNESNRVQIKCRTAEEGSVIPRGQPLSVAWYDEEKQIFVVQAVSLTDREQAQLTEFEKRLQRTDPPPRVKEKS